MMCGIKNYRSQKDRAKIINNQSGPWETAINYKKGERPASK